MANGIMQAWSKGDCIGPADNPTKYKIISVIPGGGMSKTYRVIDTTLLKDCCYKEVETANVMHFEAVVEELQIIRKIDCKQVPRVTEYFFTGSPDHPEQRDVRLGYIMDWVQGESLQNVIQNTGRIQLDLGVQWAIQICQIMESMHENTLRWYDSQTSVEVPYEKVMRMTKDEVNDRLVTKGHCPILYRDLKPSNLMVLEDGTLNLIDFGTAIELVNPGMVTDKALGTPGYAPREAYFKNSPLDLRTDIYTIGATIYHMLTGLVPTQQPEGVKVDSKPIVIRPIQELQKSIPDELAYIVHKALEQNPEDRYQSVTEMRVALERAVRYTEEVRSKFAQRKTICYTLLACAVLSASCAMYPVYKLSEDKQQNYKTQISIAESTKEPEDYKRAIAIQPAIAKPYIDLIKAFEGKMYVTEDDLLSLKDYLFPNKDKMTDQEEYGELCYTVGEMYWYYYEANGKMTRPEVSAISWFEEAEKAGYEKEKSSVYVKIGKYYEMQSKASQLTGSEIGDSLKEYWDNLKIAKGFISGGEEILKYQTYNSIAECIDDYAYQLVENGVTEQEMKAEVKELKAFMSQTNGSKQLSKKSTPLYENLQSVVPHLDEKIKIAVRGVSK